MGRILAIDYGLKRTGIAVTDPMKMIASPLETVPTSNLLAWLKVYIEKENVERIVIGMPINLDMSDTHTSVPVRNFIPKLEQQFPGLPISTVDERFTSKMAMQTMIMGGMKKKDRREKSNVDKISASLILQSFLANPGA